VSPPRAPFSPVSAIGDFDGDGRDDLAITTYAANSLAVLFSGGDGTFRAPAAVPGVIGAAAMIALDFDGDGKKDLVVADASNGTVKLLRNNAAPQR
jgi:hypothetical protein